LAVVEPLLPVAATGRLARYPRRPVDGIRYRVRAPSTKPPLGTDDEAVCTFFDPPLAFQERLLVFSG
jgi:hypothetical protein